MGKGGDERSLKVAGWSIMRKARERDGLMAAGTYSGSQHAATALH